MQNTTSLLPLPVGINRQVQSIHQVLVPTSSANPVVKQEQKKSNLDQCQLCFAIVQEQGRRKHVRGKHLRLTATCPVSGCGFEVTSDEANCILGIHVQTKHGYNTLTSDEKATFKERQAERRRAANEIFQDCFPSMNR